MILSHFAVGDLGVNYAKTETSLFSIDADFFHGMSRINPGYRSKSASGGEFVFVTFAAPMQDGEFALVNSAFAATPLTTLAASTARGATVGVVVGSPVAADRGWVQVRGVQKVRVLASVAASVELNTSATAGAASDNAATGSSVIDGVVLTSAAAAAADYPIADPLALPPIVSTYIVANAILNDAKVGRTLP
jgi:hypothetical protein